MEATKKEMEAMLVGTVKWFNNPKGYGFIQAMEETENQDVLIHYSVIDMEGFKTLKAGQVVNFEIGHGPKGLIATKVVPDGSSNTDEASSGSPATQEESVSA
ncbi:cold shock domain-containing protein [uncultured Endozoicomonas sp.]|uniref:cold shock domain-containing protein n=1 Tax=uncultured Endozoicomonas sp. TaxID=432652 RepID=UPI002607A39E|nr:cold shock domain-containing protein [uncultured Endozoicomonas sp.]